MASKYNKEIPRHGYMDFVFVVTGAFNNETFVLGVFTSMTMVDEAFERWRDEWDDLDWIAHDLRYPLAKKTEEGR
jgi:hypothetical protein